MRNLFKTPDGLNVISKVTMDPLDVDTDRMHRSIIEQRAREAGVGIAAVSQEVTILDEGRYVAHARKRLRIGLYPERQVD